MKTVIGDKIMRILVFTHRTNFSGGANRSLLSVLVGLRDKGHKIEVILPKKVGELNEALSRENISWKYCCYYRMGARTFKGIAKILSYAIVYGKLIHHYLASKKILRMIRGEKYDIVYTNTILPYAGLFVAKKCHIPSIIHDREPLDDNKVPQMIGYESFLYNHADRIIAISSDMKEQWRRRNLADKVVMINNGIPKENVDKASQKINKNFNILLTARISKSKHHMDALEAIKILKDRKIENIHLFFAGSESEKGENKYRESLKNFIKCNGLEDNVTFLGEVNNLSEIRSKMNVELMCNPNEPFGRVTVEGMRSGLVVIGVNAGGTLDIISDGENGLLYEKGNINDLVEKITLIYNNEDIRKKIANNAYEYSNKHFTMEENVGKIEKVMLDLIKD